MIREKTKYYTDIQVLGGNTIRICNRNKGSFLFSGTPQIQIIDEDDFQMHTNLSDQSDSTKSKLLQYSLIIPHNYEQKKNSWLIAS